MSRRGLEPGWVVAGILMLVLAPVLCSAARRDTPLTMEEFLSRMKDPRTFFLRVLPGEHGAVIVGGNRLHPNQIGKLKLLGSRRRREPLVAVSGIKTRQFTALLDPTCTWSWLTLPVAEELHAVALGPGIPWQMPDHLAESTLRGVASRVSTLVLDQVDVESALFLVTDAPDLEGLGRGCRQNPEMVLGAILLSRFRSLVFDFPGSQFMLASTFPYEPDAEKLVAAADFRWDKTLPMVEARVNGIPRDLIFDPAGDFELLLPELRESSTIRQLTVGELVLRNVTAVPQTDPPLAVSPYGRLGRGCYGDLKVSIVNPPGKIYFERP